VLLESDFVVSDELDGVLLEPEAAEPLGLELELDGVLLDEDEDEPPLALSFFVFRSIEVDEELEPEGAALGAAVVPLADEELGELGVAVVPLAEEDEEPGVAVVAPDGAVVEDELEERSAPRSHAVISVAPSARETATAIVDILMRPPWLGYWKAGANIGPLVLNHHQISVSGLSVLCRRLRVARPRTFAVLVRLKIAMLVGVLRIDLPLRWVRSFAFLARARRSGICRCRRRSRSRLRNCRRDVGFRRRRRSRVAIASRDKHGGEGESQGAQFHRCLRFTPLRLQTTYHARPWIACYPPPSSAVIRSRIG